ncbi:MAG: cobyrinate a,c-diamide synthase [Bryobacteraceae bacterium]
MPRLVIAGVSGDAGKTVVSLALLLAARQRGIPARAFKKGPDYIDAAWLTWAAGCPARNLDTYLMGFPGAAGSFARHASPGALNLVEGNRGLYDGVDAAGTHSTAELAKAVDAPVVLVLNSTKLTRTAAALVLGCQALDPEVRIVGVILNQVANARHERTMREAIEWSCGIPVVGAVRRLDGLVPGRHLGLVPPAEFETAEALRQRLLEVAAGLDFDRILALAGPDILALEAVPSGVPVPRVKVGYLSDSAFTFYYPDNLEALQQAGAELVPISALEAPALPEGLNALYIGGGFPETHAARLAGNRGFLDSLRRTAEAGLPVYAECGGLMLLARAIRWKGETYPMAGVFGFDVEVCARPQGHGYSRLRVDRPNPFFAEGTMLAGHEFHYSHIVSNGEIPDTACAVERGAGTYCGRDGLVIHKVWASYTHIHALSNPHWALALTKVPPGA